MTSYEKTFGKESSLDVELAVLGSAIYGKYSAEIFAQISPEEMRNDEYRDIFVRFKEWWKEHGEVNPGWIANLPDDLKETAFIAANTLPSLSYQQYVDGLKARNITEDAQSIGLKLTGARSLEDVMELTETLNKTLRQKTSAKAQSLEDLIPRFAETRTQQREYISTGFSLLNRYLFLDKGDYVVIGARPSEGKTALALSMAVAMAKNGLRVGFFSLETSEMKLMDRIVCDQCSIDFNNIKRGNLSADEWQSFSVCANDLMQLPLYLIEAAGKTTSWIVAESNRLNLDVVYIDYLGLIKGEGRSIYEQVTNISKDLHTFAQRSHTLVIALSQLNRGDPSQMPTLERLRESGQIEQDVDVAILLHNPPNGNNIRDCKMIIAKNKEGICGNIDMTFTGNLQRFRTIAK